MSTAKVVDAHIHFWQLSKGWSTALEPHMTILLKDHLPADLEPWIKAAGVAQIVVWKPPKPWRNRVLFSASPANIPSSPE